MCRRFESPACIDNPPYMAVPPPLFPPPSPFFYFFPDPQLSTTSFANITPMKNGINKNMLFSKSNTQKATPGLNLIWNNNNVKYQRETSTANEKPPSKEHYCYIIHALLIKNNAYPLLPPHSINNPTIWIIPRPHLFLQESLQFPFYDFPNNSIPYK